MLWRDWIGRLILPVDPLPQADVESERATDAALRAADQAGREFRNLERRARALGIEVDVERVRRPRGDP